MANCLKNCSYNEINYESVTALLCTLIQMFYLQLRIAQYFAYSNIFLKTSDFKM